jgi:hypothetical protein
LEASPRKKVGEIPSQSIKAHACHPSYTGSLNRRTAIHIGLGYKSETLFEKSGRAPIWQVQGPELKPQYSLFLPLSIYIYIYKIYVHTYVYMDICCIKLSSSPMYRASDVHKT